MKLRKGIILVVSVRHSVHKGRVPCDHYPWCIGPHRTGILQSQLKPHSSETSYPWTWSNLFNLDLLVQESPSPLHPEGSNLLMMKHVWLISGRLASYWNAFLISLIRCKSMRDFKTCTDKLTCALVNEKLRSIVSISIVKYFRLEISWVERLSFCFQNYTFASNCQNCNQASRYSEMVRNIDNNWAAIQQKIDSNTNFDFFDDLTQLSREIKNYDKGYYLWRLVYAIFLN